MDTLLRDECDKAYEGAIPGTGPDSLFAHRRKIFQTLAAASEVSGGITVRAIWGFNEKSEEPPADALEWMGSKIVQVTDGYASLSPDVLEWLADPQRSGGHGGPQMFAEGHTRIVEKLHLAEARTDGYVTPETRMKTLIRHAIYAVKYYGRDSFRQLLKCAKSEVGIVRQELQEFHDKGLLETQVFDLMTKLINERCP